MAAGPGGYAGLAVLFAELAHHDESYAKPAGRYLELAWDGLAADTRAGWYDGLVAVAFAARVGGREVSLDRLDRQLLARTNALVYAEHKRTTAGWPGADPATYGLAHGLTGLGAYLLTAGTHMLADVLTALVALTEPVRVAGHQLPGWWVPRPPPYGRATATDGYLELGMEHGVAGPLALLALSWRAGVRVAGQQDAVRRIADWLTARVQPAGDGVAWPATVTAAQELGHTRLPRAPGRLAWCDGTPGVARALYLAGTALGEDRWTDLAVTAMTSAPDPAPAGDPALRRGWAGALHVAGWMARDTADARLAAYTHRLAERLLAAPEPTGTGLLDGAPGVALALHAYARDAAPTGGWDRVLLVT